MIRTAQEGGEGGVGRGGLVPLVCHCAFLVCGSDLLYHFLLRLYSFICCVLCVTPYLGITTQVNKEFFLC